ncbi:xylulokinase [Staphylococcus kloosii]|uniref:xylulokinase n=1 Tax=Staphylococcus kloosii TaxID=29384 RepID=UPI000D1E67B3|nr:xylulokinase [Staphylococcus kloosii]PTJ80217.1 xylulokinase [Staphylococcus kloosii]
MENVVLGIDLGTSSVKTIAVNKQGEVVTTVSEPLELIQNFPGYNEQDPEAWFEATKKTITAIIQDSAMQDKRIEGISFSGQMHGLVPLDKSRNLIRNAILWNDTRTTEQCEQLAQRYGDTLLKNPILEGFTLPKLLWLKQHEPDNWNKLDVFVLPKDYVRYRLTGELHMEYSDAAGTLLLDPETNEWAEDIASDLELGDIFPPLVASHCRVGVVTDALLTELGLEEEIAVFAGGADNACGALGAGVINEDQTLCSIGTSGVILAPENSEGLNYGHNIHYFKHVLPNTAYAMGVTLSAGYSLNWFKDTVFPETSFEDMIEAASKTNIGANGLIYAPYIQGERTPHGDATVRGSFIGLSGSTTAGQMARATIEGITYALYEAIVFMRQAGKSIDHIISIGGGAKSEFWLQLQADVFNTKVSKLNYEEGPGMGAAMLAAVGLEWFDSFEDCAKQFIKTSNTYTPNEENHQRYTQYFEIYRQVYAQTKDLSRQLLAIEQN